jgi:outer membrane protein assembly factor BamB
VKNEARSIFALMPPVVATDVNTPQGKKTLVFVAGTSDNISALDAENGNIVWTRTFDTHVLPKDDPFWLCPNAVNATPTIDRATNLVYAMAVDGRLYGMDLGNGDVEFGPVQFVAPFSKNWSLNLFQGSVFTSLSQGCGGNPSGFYSMEVRDRMQPAVRDLFISRGSGAGIWGRGGPVIGQNGKVYAATGDGTFDPNHGEYGSSVIAASTPDLKIVDYYTPTGWNSITREDLDISSASPVWFSYQNFNLLAVGGKEAVVYLLDADALGAKDHHTPLFITPLLGNDERDLQQEGIWGALSAWRDDDGGTWVYVPIWGPMAKHAPNFPIANGPNSHGSVMAFKVELDRATNTPTLAPAWVSGDFKLPDPPIVANGVLFAVATGENPAQTRPGAHDQNWKKNLLTDKEKAENTRNAVLYALDAKTGKVLYQSGDAIATWVHFSGLALADGRVYAVDHDSNVYCFGLKKSRGK